MSLEEYRSRLKNFSVLKNKIAKYGTSQTPSQRSTYELNLQFELIPFCAFAAESQRH